MKLKFADMKPGTIYIDTANNLCVKLQRQGSEATFSAVLMYDPEDTPCDKPLTYLFAETAAGELVIPNAFDLKRFFPED